MPVDWTNVTASVLKSMAQEPLVNREYSLGGLAWNSWFESMNLLMIEVQDVAKMENTTCPEIYDICMVRMAARNRLQQEINARFEHDDAHPELDQLKNVVNGFASSFKLDTSLAVRHHSIIQVVPTIVTTARPPKLLSAPSERWRQRDGRNRTHIPPRLKKVTVEIKVPPPKRRRTHPTTETPIPPNRRKRGSLIDRRPGPPQDLDHTAHNTSLDNIDAPEASDPALGLGSSSEPSIREKVWTAYHAFEREKQVVSEKREAYRQAARELVNEMKRFGVSASFE